MRSCRAMENLLARRAGQIESGQLMQEDKFKPFDAHKKYNRSDPSHEPCNNTKGQPLDIQSGVKVPEELGIDPKHGPQERKHGKTLEPGFG